MSPAIALLLLALPHAMAQAPAPTATTAAPAAATTDTKAAHTRFSPVGVVLAGEQATVISNRRQANQRVDPTVMHWSPMGFELVVNGGVKVMGADDSSWWRVGTPSAKAQKLSDLLAMAGGPGGWVESTDRGNGRILAYGTIGGQKARVGMLHGPPTASIVLMAPLGGGTGKESRRLAMNHGFAKNDAGAPLNKIPEGATALPVTPPDAAVAATWTEELGKLRGGAVTATWSTTVDLDRDGAAEGVLCVQGGTDDSDCYVVDAIDGVNRWYGLATMRWTGGDASQAPLAFTHGDGTYVMHVPTGGQARPVVLLTRWDGSRYLTQSVQ